MSKRLRDNVNSAYWGAAQRLYPKQTKQKIVVYVESYEDVAFWRSLLSVLESDERAFQIMPPTADALSKGKKMALMSVLQNTELGTNMIACVDSDYDYLLQDATFFSQKMNSAPYIFQTYTYAIENYHCYAETLHEVCVQATLNDRVVINFEEFFKQYSENIYPLFLWNIHFYRTRREKIFSMTDFNSFTGLSEVQLDHIQNCLALVQQKVDSKVSRMEHQYPKEVNAVVALGQELRTLGVTPDNVYFFVQGHHLMDNVVLKLLTPICATLRHEREFEIRRLARTEEQFNNELQCYHNGICSIEMALHRNMNFHELFLYKKLIDKIRESL